MSTYPGAGGATLHYDTIRSGGTPIVALAGGAARHPDYLGDLAGVGTGGFHLVVPHLRGVGRSPLPAGDASYWAQAEDLERLREHLGLERMIVLGHSAGTRLANSYAARFPDRLGALILVTPPTGYLVDTESDAERIIAPRRGDPVLATALAAWQAGPPPATGDDETDDANLTAWFVATGPVSYARWGETERAHARVGVTSYRANRAFFAADPPDDLPKRLGKVTAPVLVVAGGEDYSTGLAPVLAVAGLFPGGRAVTIDGSGHFPWVERPAEFRTAVDAFLGEL